jgi:hypothetical protein
LAEVELRACGEIPAMWQAIESHLESRQVARVIYGSIIGLALVVVLEAHPPSAGVVVTSVLATALAVGLAELYSEIVGTETRVHRRIARHEVLHLLNDVGAVFFGIAFPAVFFVLAALDAIQLDTAFTIAKWSGLGLIGGYGFCAARLAGAGLAASFLQALVVAGIGGLLIAIKALVH